MQAPRGKNEVESGCGSFGRVRPKLPRASAVSVPLHLLRFIGIRSMIKVSSTICDTCVSKVNIQRPKDIMAIRSKRGEEGWGSTNESRSSGEQHDRSLFLELPRELRDLVYELLIYERRTPPENPDNAGERAPCSSTTPGSIVYEAKSPKPAVLQLKLCNRQIYTEVNEMLKTKVRTDIGPTHLDIMIKGSAIWPTWTALPVTPHLSPTIQINLRIFEATDFGSEFSTGAYRALWSLFNRMIFRGPCLIHSRDLPKPLEVGRLRFEIMLCFPTTVDDLFGTYRDVFERLEKLAYDNVGLGNVGTIEACLGADRRVWRLRQLPTGLTFASRINE